MAWLHIRNASIYAPEDLGPGDVLCWDGRIVAVADVIGDWREEIIVSAKGEMRIYGTTIPARDRRTCLMQDPLYRMDVVVAAMGYTQCPMLSVDLASRHRK